MGRGTDIDEAFAARPGRAVLGSDRQGIQFPTALIPYTLATSDHWCRWREGVVGSG